MVHTFMARARASSPAAAFILAVREARLARVTGSIGDLNNFVVLPLPANRDPEVYADQLISRRDPRIENVAGCFELAPGDYFFFGWVA